jgi:hypothetical protein
MSEKANPDWDGVMKARAREVQPPKVWLQPAGTRARRDEQLRATLEALVREYAGGGECLECAAEVCRNIPHDADCVVGRVDAALRGTGEHA